jgi:phosphopantetheine--protein transferase-like protein
VIVCAVARETVLGIDIEELIPKPPLSIAKHFFTRIEAAAVAQCPADNQASLFYRLWTLKEAYLKAIGTGLSQPLDGIEFQFCSDTITVTHKSPAAKKHRDCTFWSLRSIPLREQSPCTWPQLARSL